MPPSDESLIRIRRKIGQVELLKCDEIAGADGRRQRKTRGVEILQIVCSRQRNIGKGQKGLECFLSRLLGVKAYRVVRAAKVKESIGGEQVTCRFAEPLPRVCLPIVHRGRVPRAARQK